MKYNHLKLTGLTAVAEMQTNKKSSNISQQSAKGGKRPKLSADETHGDPSSRVSGECIIVVRSFYSMKGFQLPCTACLLILHLEF